MIGSSRNLQLSRDIVEINFLTLKRGILVVCVVVVAVQGGDPRTVALRSLHHKRQERVRTR